MLKKCGGCDLLKRFDEFHKNRRRKDGLQVQCKVCMDDKRRAWEATHGQTRKDYSKKFVERAKKRYAEDPEYRERKKKQVYDWVAKNKARKKAVDRNCMLRREYDLTQEEFDKILAAQGNVCALCRKTKKRYVVDHDHELGPTKDAIRGILCHGCNVALGGLGDTVEALQRAIDYLQRHTKQFEPLPFIG